MVVVGWSFYSRFKKRYQTLIGRILPIPLRMAWTRRAISSLCFISSAFGAMSGRQMRGSSDGKIAGLYDLAETIGKGHYAVVKLARHVFTGEKVAVKVIDKTKLDEVSRAHLFQEVRCMKLVQHPHVVRLYEVIDTATRLYLVLEWGDGGDMYDYIMRHDRGLQETVARRYFSQIVQAIRYCHQLHVVHRDLKPENVVFFTGGDEDEAGVVKLTDFGFSNKFVPGRQLETSCGSLAYSAPEILLGDSYDPPAVGGCHFFAVSLVSKKGAKKKALRLQKYSAWVRVRVSRVSNPSYMHTMYTNRHWIGTKRHTTFIWCNRCIRQRKHASCIQLMSKIWPIVVMYDKN